MNSEKIIHCRFLIDLENKDKSTRHILGRVGSDINELKVEEYHKSPGTFMATFYIKIEAETNEKLIYKLLKFCSGIVRSTWTFDGPFDSGNIGFSCIIKQ